MPAAPRAITYIDTSVWCAYCFNEPEAPEAVAPAISSPTN